jgi:predicted Zn-dependent protease
VRNPEWLFVPVVVAALASSLQWLTVNSEPAAGFARLHAYLAEGRTPSELDRALTWDFLAQRNARFARWSEAADAAAHAAELAPHRRIFLMWALAETMQGDYRSAGRVYRMLLARHPNDPLGWLGLAGVAARLGQQDTLQDALARLRSYAPESWQARVIRRYLARFPEVWPGPRR